MFALSVALYLWLMTWDGGGLRRGLLMALCGTQAICSLALMLYINFYLVIPSGLGRAGVGAGGDGISLTRITQAEPTPFVAHVAKIDLARFKVTFSPPDLSDERRQYKAMTTSRALETYGGALAVNASFFRPFRDRHLFDFYPHSGDRVDAIGKTIFNGVEVGVHGRDWPVLAASESGLRIGSIADVTASTESDSPQMMVSGKSLLVKGGIRVAVSDGASYPRTAAGIDEQGRYLWLIVVDGKQPRYSQGIGLEDLADIMVQLGVYDAIELDGGGSATMAVANDTGVEVINRPSHTNLPDRERPVANHLLVQPR